MKSLLTFLLFSMALAGPSFSQDHDESSILKAIDSKEYIFRVRSILPATGGTRQVTSPYDLTVNKDSLISFLPYFGRAYTATIGQTTDPLNFTSTKFTYTLKEGKKGGWIIQIRPRDAREIQVMTLNVSKAGYATLNVNQQNRQNISYTGVVEPLAKVK